MNLPVTGASKPLARNIAGTLFSIQHAVSAQAHRCKAMKWTRLLAVLIVLAGTGSDAAARASDLQVQTLTGETVPLSTFFEPGKWTMVMMWTTYCGICRSQYPTVSAFHNKHKDTDAKVIGISLDGYPQSGKVQAYIASSAMAFDSVISEVDAIAPAYQAITEERFTGTPTYLMFDPQGALVAHVPGTLTMEDVEEFISEYDQP